MEWTLDEELRAINNKTQTAEFKLGTKWRQGDGGGGGGLTNTQDNKIYFTYLLK